MRVVRDKFRELESHAEEQVVVGSNELSQMIKMVSAMEDLLQDLENNQFPEMLSEV